jgi:hypothetical protein
VDDGIQNASHVNATSAFTVVPRRRLLLLENENETAHAPDREHHHLLHRPNSKDQTVAGGAVIDSTTVLNVASSRTNDMDRQAVVESGLWKKMITMLHVVRDPWCIIVGSRHRSRFVRRGW